MVQIQILEAFREGVEGDVVRRAFLVGLEPGWWFEPDREQLQGEQCP